MTENKLRRNRIADAALREMKRLLKIEYDEEMGAFAQMTKRVGVARLVARGNAWFPLKLGSVRFNSLNKRVIEVHRTLEEDDEENEHNFEYGRSVVFFEMNEEGNLHRLFPGTVNMVEADKISIVINEAADVGCLRDGKCGVLLSLDETTYKAMFEAIDKTRADRGRLGELRDLIYSDRKAEESSCGRVSFPYLNSSQELGVNAALRAKDVAVLHGPPGTGKTTTLVEAIYETLRREPQVLVCAQSNMAVDWICEKLVDRGVNVLRIGNPSRVNDKMLSFTYERRFEDHPDYSTLWAVRKAIAELKASGEKGSRRRRDRLGKLHNRAAELSMRINADLFGQANVIASTLVGSIASVLKGRKFNTLFIDEAAQALEAACLIPMQKASRVIFAGDHCQLPPTVKSYEAMRGGLAKSLMETVAERHPEAVTLLTTQYRMNEEIMRFSSREFYGGAMCSHPSVKWRGLLSYDLPMEWIDTAKFKFSDDDEAEGEENFSFREQASGDGLSRVNRDEGLATLLVLQNYIEKIGVRRFLDERIDVGIISPYQGQVRFLRRMLKRVPFFKPVRKMLTVNTVDGFQGQERDVIVISMVRSNDDNNIGFLRDLRRMNVAITRARMKVLIIGDASTLTKHPFYRRLFNYIKSLK